MGDSFLQSYHHSLVWVLSQLGLGPLRQNSSPHFHTGWLKEGGREDTVSEIQSRLTLYSCLKRPMGSGLVQLVCTKSGINLHCLFYHSISADSEYIAAISTKLRSRGWNILVIRKSEDDRAKKSKLSVQKAKAIYLLRFAQLAGGLFPVPPPSPHSPLASLPFSEAVFLPKKKVK